MADVAAELQKATADMNLTRDAREVLERAVAIAAERGASQADPIDVLGAVLDDRGTLADQGIRAVGGDPAAVRADLPQPGSSPGLPLRQLIVNANREAHVLGHYQVDSIHLLLAMLYSDSPQTAAVLQKAGLTLYDLRNHLQTGATKRVSGDGRVGAVSPPDRALRRRPLPSLRGVLGISRVFLLLVVATVGSGVVLWVGLAPGLVGPITIVFVTAGWITSVCVHEFGHALVAYLGGDRSVVASGYLTLDPLRYTNILLSLVMPIIFLLLGGIGLPGGAVYIQHAAIRNRLWDSAVSLAGPVGTLLCGLLLAIPFIFLGRGGGLPLDTRLDFFSALGFLVFIEGVALLLNLLPIPGLDGFGIIRPWLPYSVQDLANRFGQLAIIGVFIALWYVAPVRLAFFSTILQLTTLAGVDPALIFFGQQHMRLA
jgi:Zn-dependent protease